MTISLSKRLLYFNFAFYIHHKFNSVIPRSDFFSSLRGTYTFNILLMIQTTLPNEAVFNLCLLIYSQFPSALLSFFLSITVLGNGAGWDTRQCEKVKEWVREWEREIEKEMGIRVPENSAGYDTTAKLWKLLGFGNSPDPRAATCAVSMRLTLNPPWGFAWQTDSYRMEETGKMRVPIFARPLT